ncbi:MAG: hypothetical protein Q4D76_00375 [Oscillospiraceae bacterium]|nr:hypothetical protein [Oscillospiraceae bacterium]
MKKIINYFLTVALAAVLSVSVLSCGRKTVMIDDELPKLPDPVKIVTDPPVVYDEPEEEETVPETDSAPHLKQGVWYAYSPTGSSYYFFEGDNESGLKISVNTGVSSPLRYEKISENTEESTQENQTGPENYIFHFDREDNNTAVSIEFTDNDHASVIVNGSKEEYFEYVSSQSFAEFMFYTNEELSAMAKEEYAKVEDNPVRIKQIQVNIGEKPGSEVVLQLVRKVINKENGAEEMQVCESYTVNRITAQGVDSAGNHVDLSK